MIPLKVSWWRRNPRIYLCQAWIAVQLGAHRNAPSRIRRKLTKAADWLEATVERISNVSQYQYGRHNEDKENQVVSSLAQLYYDLHKEMNANSYNRTRMNMEIRSSTCSPAARLHKSRSLASISSLHTIAMGRLACVFSPVVSRQKKLSVSPLGLSPQLLVYGLKSESAILGHLAGGVADTLCPLTAPCNGICEQLKPFTGLISQLLAENLEFCRSLILALKG
ncbi:hypothetical protein RRG08_013139 [Elysia crispata]|uniref:Uncharacterized protein n=1 Tax=Elysia crispata TaxID=231223 RepID=A0AAE1DQS9_9GAST|nr:hypothetical protein RRG08_013139 [Elysia crispata]